MGLYQLVLLQKGIHGTMVKRVQEALGIDADGAFGPNTEKAVKAWQENNGFEVTGMVDPAMLAALQFPEFTPETVEQSVITEETLARPVDFESAVQQDIAQPEHHEGFIAHAADAVADVGKSIWNTVKSIF